MIRAVSVLGATLLAAAAAMLLYDAVLGSPGGRTWSAEFTDARGLLPGADVRVGGAPAGRVTAIALSPRGTALVRFQLAARAAAPRADAAAAIEPADLLGDTYLSLSPGSAAAPLAGAIDTAHTVNAPRLDEVLDAFSPRVRDGLRVALLESGLALDGRGGQLAQTVVALRPALRAAGGVLRELDTQTGALDTLVPAAAGAAGQLDSRRGDIGPLLDGFSRTVGATAAGSTALSHGVAGLPLLLAKLRTTSSAIAATAAAATPVAERLAPLTGTLAAAVTRLPPFAAAVRGAAPGFTAGLGTAGGALARGASGFATLSRALGVLRGQAPEIGTLLGELDAAAPGIAQGFFVDFPDQAAESGRQPFDPFADPRRAYWRGAAVFTCEAFGVPVRPGCLSEALANLDRQRNLAADRTPAARRGPGRRAGGGAPGRRPGAPAAAAPPPGAPPPANPLPSSPVGQLLGFLLGK